MATPKVLILFAHPQWHRSRVNRYLSEAVRALPGVTWNDLYAAYPDFYIDVAREQELLLAHEFIVLQHPLYWYSAPAIVKEWLDVVLLKGWAYGDGGDKLRRKQLKMVLSCGGSLSAYQATGSNRFTTDEFLRPFEQTAHLCGMLWKPPLILHDARLVSDEALQRHAEEYRACLEAAVQSGTL